MKIATFNVNGINGRLPVLLRWLAEAKPDAVCLQELKAPQEKFPEAAIRDAGYGAIWQGQKADRMPICAEQKSGARPQVRLQTALVRTTGVLRLPIDRA